MRDDLDNLIDGALAEYSAAEPLAGLEQRVLNRVQSERPARKPRWWWAVAFVASVLAAVAIGVLARKPEALPIAAVAPPPVVVAPVSAAVVPSATRRRPPKPRRAAGARALPKRGVFPTLSPLSREERLLVQLAESSPQLLLAQPVDEIQIKPIEIAPLQIDGGQ